MKKKVLAAVIAAVIMSQTVSAATPWHFKGKYYAQICKVTRVAYIKKKDADRVRIRNANGQVYVCWTDPGDYDRGDRVSVIMDTNGTRRVLDDKVVAIKYDRPDLL